MAPAVATAAHRSSSGKAHSAKSGGAKSGVAKSGSAKAGTKSVSAKSGGKKKKGAKSDVRRTRGQQAIEPERVTEIQQALIREKYLDGEADGRWDARTIGAMQKYQADQGWQTKLMPDSRALKKLGLGADYSNALNAKEVSQTAPTAPGTTTPEQAAAFAQAAGVNR
jgi:hypothetical protein